MSAFILNTTYDLLRSKISDLKKEINENSSNISTAAAFGDISDNAEYQSAKQQQEFLFARLRQLEQHLYSAIINEKNIDVDIVAFGTLVTLFDKEQNKEVEYNILGPAELELFKDIQIITYGSPIGQLLIGKKIGDTITSSFNNSTRTLTVLNIQKAFNTLKQ
jgi:transcription elongation factor GreA